MDNLEKVRKEIYLFGLENAIKFNGKANPNALIGKIISQNPKIKKDMALVKKEINEIITKINSKSLDEQKKEFENLDTKIINDKKNDKDRDIFAFLNLDNEKEVITAFPPGPEKYPHIGHAKALLLNYLLAKKYNGKFILRFEDTNPNLVLEKFYDIMIENFKWLDVNFDELLYASDYMDKFYEYAINLIKSNNAYMCNCNLETIRNNRMSGISCKCRTNDFNTNLNLWNKFHSMPENEYVLRLKIDLLHKNSTMRDPTIFRVIDKKHPRIDKKYRVWPNYDFQNAIMDSISNVTIRLRSKEFEMRGELQNYIQKILGLKITKTYEFARFNMKGVLSSGRIIREKVLKKELIGWDDPSLTTIVALRRRGFTKDAIKNFVISTGITKSESTLTWDDLIMHNKRILDKSAKRYFFIEDYIKIEIINTKSKEVKLKTHPELEVHDRIFNIDSNFYVSKKDIAKMDENSIYRLMDCINFVKKNGKYYFHSDDFESFKNSNLNKKIIHWLSFNDKVIECEILMPDKRKVIGICENNLIDLPKDSIIQFERFGFCRLDEIENNKRFFWFTH
ncbi:MAG: glutamate--tRNA ligase [Nanoarchaeota archaeon]